MHRSSREYYGLKYLQYISDFCENNSIRLIFIVFPYSSVYNEYLSQDQTWIKDLIHMDKKDNYFEFYDFSRFFESELLDSKHFSDGSHLNSNGGVIFTNHIKEKLLLK